MHLKADSTLKSSSSPRLLFFNEAARMGLLLGETLTDAAPFVALAAAAGQTKSQTLSVCVLVESQTYQVLLHASALHTLTAGTVLVLGVTRAEEGQERRMPKVISPPSLRRAALRTICHEFELICYGVSRHSSQYRAFLKAGGYLKHQQNPALRQLPVHVFTELVTEVFLELGSAPHVLHAVVQPQMVECRLPSSLRFPNPLAASICYLQLGNLTSTLPLAIKLLVERVNSLHTFELTCCKSLSPLILAACLPYLPTLTFLNLEVVPDAFILEFTLMLMILQRAHLLTTLVWSSLDVMCPAFSPSMWLEPE